MELNDYLAYAVIVTGNDHDGYTAKLRGIKGAITGADTYAETLELAQSMITDYAGACLQDGKEMPPSAKPEKGDVMVRISEDAAAKIMLRNEMIRKGVKVTSLAQKLGMLQPQLSRTLRLTTSTKLAVLAKISRAIGTKLNVTLA